MNQDKQQHVLGLDPRQQLCLRLLLYNMYCGFLRKMLSDVFASERIEVLEAKTTLTLATFDKYNQLIDLLANSDNFHKCKSKVIMVYPVMMKNLVVAVQSFDEQSHNLDSGELYYVNQEFAKVREKVLKSYEFLYTEEEITKMRNER